MRHSALMVLVGSVVGITSSAFAASVPVPGGIDLGKGFKAHAYVDTYYQYNFNKTPISESPATTPQVNYRFHDRAHNQFQLNNATIGFSHSADPVGFVAEVGFGPLMDALNLTGPADTTVDRTNVYIRRAHLEWKRGGYTLQVGRIDAGFGLEDINAANNWNYSRSLQFALFQPKFVTGINNMYRSDAGFYATLGVFNGIDRFTDNNRGKTWATKLGYAKDKLDVGVSYFTGPENDARSGDWRHVVGAHAKYMLGEKAGVGFETSGSFGDREQINSAGLRSSAQQYGVSLLGNVELIENNTDSLRVEWMKDDDGAGTLIPGTTDLWSITLTHRLWVNPNLSFWLEGRYDDADRKAFSNKTGALDEENQFTATLAATYYL